MRESTEAINNCDVYVGNSFGSHFTRDILLYQQGTRPSKATPHGSEFRNVDSGYMFHLLFIHTKKIIEILSHF